MARTAKSRLFIVPPILCLTRYGVLGLYCSCKGKVNFNPDGLPTRQRGFSSNRTADFVTRALRGNRER